MPHLAYHPISRDRHPRIQPSYRDCTAAYGDLTSKLQLPQPVSLLHPGRLHLISDDTVGVYATVSEDVKFKFAAQASKWDHSDCPSKLGFSHVRLLDSPWLLRETYQGKARLSLLSLTLPKLRRPLIQERDLLDEACQWSFNKSLSS